MIDYDELRKLAREHKPKMIVSGATAYPARSISRHSDDRRRSGRHAHVRYGPLLRPDRRGRIPIPRAARAHSSPRTTHKSIRAREAE